MRGAAALVVLAALAGAAPAAPREDPLAGRIAGKAVECIDPSQVLSPEIPNNRTILYRQSLKRVWRNDLPEPCRGLRPNQTLIVRTAGDRMCRGDYFRSRDPGSVPGPLCRLGAFTPYDLPAK